MIKLSDIAKEAGVSIGTVDRALHNRGRVSEKTKERIFAIAKRMDYQVNPIARNLSLNKTTRFAVLMPKASDDSNYWSLPLEGILNISIELKKFNIEVKVFHFDRHSNESFLQASEIFRKEKFDGLLLAPVNESFASALIQELDGNIPYAFFDTTINANPIINVRQNAFQSGTVAAKLMSQVVDTEGDILMLQAEKDDEQHIKRINGFKDYFNHKRLNHTLVHYEIEKINDLDYFRQQFKTMVSNHSRIAGIFITNSGIHHIHDFLKEEKLIGVKLIAYDLVEKNKQYLKDNKIEYIISQRPEMQGREGILALYQSVFLKELNLAERTIPIDIFTAENV